MCVPSGSAATFGRGDFARIVAGVALPFAIAEPSAAAEKLAPAFRPLPAPPPGMRRGNVRATLIASKSPLAQASFSATSELARSIGDVRLRTAVLSLLADPRPTFTRAHPTVAGRSALRDRLVAATLLAPEISVEMLFPPGTEAEATAAPQPFWSTPGSGEGSHHAYPGGLAVHELFNARIGESLARHYDRLYFAERATIDRDVVVAAALYHDVMKSVIFQWNEDGTLTREISIAGTGAHHIFSAAEAIARGHDARFVITVLSAHAAPSLGEEKKVASWARAAAMMAGVDPIAMGLLRRGSDGDVLAADYVPIEAFINHLSDHDYVLSIHAMHEVLPQLDKVGTLLGRSVANGALAWWRLAILANVSAIALYHDLTSGGESKFDARVRALSAKLEL